MAPPSSLDCKIATAKPEPYSISGFVDEIYTQFKGICRCFRRPPPRLDSRSHPHFTISLEMKMTAVKSGSITTWLWANIVWEMNKVATFHVIWMSFEGPQLYSTGTKWACHIALEPEVQNPRWRPLNRKCTICKLADYCIVELPTATPIFLGSLNQRRNLYLGRPVYFRVGHFIWQNKLNFIEFGRCEL